MTEAYVFWAGFAIGTLAITIFWWLLWLLDQAIASAVAIKVNQIFNQTLKEYQKKK